MQIQGNLSRLSTWKRHHVYADTCGYRYGINAWMYPGRNKHHRGVDIGKSCVKNMLAANVV